MARDLLSIKPQDALILLKLVARRGEALKQMDLARALNLSVGEISYGLQRLRAAKLLNEQGELQPSNVLEFLVHAIKYLVPAALGRVSRGVPTAHSAAPLASKIRSSAQEAYVLATPNGTMRGQSLNPIYKTASDAALKDAELHQLIALVDAIRVGRAREQKMAQSLLEKKIRNKDV